MGNDDINLGADEKYSTVNADSSIGFLIDLISGVFGGCAGVLGNIAYPPFIVGQPLDTIKVRLQTHTGKPIGIFKCFTKIVAKEGARGLYKGMVSPMVGVAVANSALFAVYGSTIRLCADDLENPGLLSIFFAGAVSGAFNAFISCPMELIKIRLQNQTDATKSLYKGPIDCVRQIIIKNGLRGLFKAFPTTLVREIPSYGIYFASYEVFCRSMPTTNPNEASLGVLTAGGFAGILAWAITYPFDVIKTRLQSIQEDQNPKYRNMRNALRVIRKEEGKRVFFAGLGATSIRAFPVNAATFFTVVSARNFLEQKLC